MLGTFGPNGFVPDFEAQSASYKKSGDAQAMSSRFIEDDGYVQGVRRGGGGSDDPELAAQELAEAQATRDRGGAHVKVADSSAKVRRAAASGPMSARTKITLGVAAGVSVLGGLLYAVHRAEKGARARMQPQEGGDSAAATANRAQVSEEPAGEPAWVIEQASLDQAQATAKAV